MGPRTSRSRFFPSSRYYRKTRARRIQRLVPSASSAPQNAGMLFTSRVLGNPLSNSEHKYFDSTVNQRAVTQVASTFINAMQNPSTLNTIFCPVTGTDYNQRIGRRVSVLSWRIRGEFVLPNVSDTASMGAVAGLIFRLICCIDKQCNGTQMQSSDLIAMPSALNSAWDMYQSPANFGRFKVLKDKRLSIQDPNYNSEAMALDRNGRVVFFDYKFRFRRPVVVHFNSTSAGTIADLVDNAFNVIAAVNDSSSAPTITYKSRVTYIDV